jgi:hypothetical protein
MKVNLTIISHSLGFVVEIQNCPKAEIYLVNVRTRNPTMQCRIIWKVLLDFVDKIAFSKLRYPSLRFKGFNICFKHALLQWTWWHIVGS